MRIKVDENIPISAGQPFRSAGHDVDTVTLDRGFGDIRAYAPGGHEGILVLRTADQSPAAVTRDVERLRTEVDLEELAGCIAVFRDGELRVRPPRR
ncbi:MAG: DUF5615 family PIN-like protein [Nitriliruptorales bacterium]